MPVIRNVRKILTDATKNVLPYCTGSINTGLCMFTCPGETIVVHGRSDRASPVASHEGRGRGDGFSSGQLWPHTASS